MNISQILVKQVTELKRKATILENQGALNDPCNVCIKYYNFSSEEFEVQDKLELNSGKLTFSSKHIWEGRLYKKASSNEKAIFDIGSKSGKIND